MLRTSQRSIGLNYRRLWELSITNSLTSSSRSSQGRGEYLHSESSVGYNSNFTDWKSPRAQCSELETSSVQHYNNRNARSIINDEFSRNGRAGIALKSFGPHSSSVLVQQGPATSLSSILEESLSARAISSSFVCPSHHWALGRAIRLATSKAGAVDAVEETKRSEEGGGRGPEEEKSAARTFEDFQHEEIVGPTVERDPSETADQVRESLTELRSCMASFGTGFVILGTVQMAAAICSWVMKTDPISLWRDLPFVIMSYTLAYFLKNTGSAMHFFSTMEGRSRLRILTLSLQVIKGLSQFFHRSSVMVKFVAFTTLVALIKQVFPFS